MYLKQRNTREIFYFYVKIYFAEKKLQPNKISIYGVFILVHCEIRMVSIVLGSTICSFL